MAAKKAVLVSRFPEVKKAAREAVQKAVDQALAHGESEAEKRLERIDDTRGYELPINIEQQKDRDGGKISYDPWYGKFFEYGTVRIPAAPFMRPAHRKMRKVFKDVMADDFEGFVRKRVRR